LIIRACETGDLAEITAIYRDAVLTGTASFEIDPPDLAEMTRRRQTLLDGGYPYLVAEAEHHVVGYAYAGLYRARLAYRSTVENSVYVARPARGKGLARQLLSRLIEECTARGFRQMIAVIGDSGNDASIRLHEAADFTHVGVLRSVGWKHGRWLDTVLMQRVLGDGDTTASERVRTI
jgi:phosphinothricin acetyltransferase